LAAQHEQHLPPVAAQVQHEQTASHNPALLASANHGHPPIAATARPAVFTGAGVVAAHGATGPAPHTAVVAPRPGGMTPHPAATPAAPHATTPAATPPHESPVAPAARIEHAPAGGGAAAPPKAPPPKAPTSKAPPKAPREEHGEPR
jgi:hypothetical protein